MKVLGLIGGMSWESTVIYYQLVNRRVREKMGGLHSSRCIVFSFDFAEIESLQAAGNWDEAATLMGQAASSLRKGGAEGIVICTNTMHKLASAVESGSGLPLIHIADATAERIKREGFSRVGLLGTRYTMEQDFYKGRLVEKYGLEVSIPDEPDRDTVHNIIYDELCHGVITKKSLSAYTEIVNRLAKAGAQCVILGCTEIGLLLKQDGASLPLFDTTVIHAEAAADWAMSASRGGAKP
jgi:aspartate racemase